MAPFLINNFIDSASVGLNLLVTHSGEVLIKNPKEFFKLLKIDLFQDEIFVFSPKGDVSQLPIDSSPIDFAFNVKLFEVKSNKKLIVIDDNWYNLSNIEYGIPKFQEKILNLFKQ